MSETGQDRREQKDVELTLDDARERLQAQHVQRVWDAWVEATGKSRSRLDAKRRRLIRSRLKEWPVEDLEAAVRGWRHSAYHRGENEQRREYNSLELCLRDAQHIEDFRDLERGAATVSSRGHLDDLLQGRAS